MGTLNWREDTFAKCPFYVKDIGVTIVCESPYDYPEVTAKLQISIRNKNGYMDKYCRNGYKECPVYKDIMRKYEGQS